MTGSAQIDVDLRQGAIYSLVGKIIEVTPDDSTVVIRAGSGFSGDETIKFCLRKAETDEITIDAEAASIVDNAEATVTFTLTATHTADAGRYLYYWIIDDIGGGGGRRRTVDQTLNVAAIHDTFTG